MVGRHLHAIQATRHGPACGCGAPIRGDLHGFHLPHTQARVTGGGGAAKEGVSRPVAHARFP